MKRVTVKDIANRLNLSLGTINKALNNKSGISDETRKRVLETAIEMGYRVNKVAQSMARNVFKIGIVLPDEWSAFYDQIKRGIDRQLDALYDYNVVGIYYSVNGIYLGDSWFEVLERCANEVDAVIICPPQNHGLENAINELVDKGIFVLTLEGDIGRCRRHVCVQVNHKCAGELAAEMAQYTQNPHKREAAVFVGNKDMDIHGEKALAFCRAAETFGFPVAGIFETQDDYGMAKYLTEKLLNEKPELGLIFSATGNYQAICEYIDEQKISDVQVIGVDTYPFTQAYFEKGILRAVISQDAEEQGKCAVRTVYDVCLEAKKFKEYIQVVPKVILRSNAALGANENLQA